MNSKGNSPRIIVTGPEKRLRFGWWATNYFTGRVGLNAQYVTKHTERYGDNVAGVIIGGGDDIGPELYGLPVPEDKRYDRERDQLELKIIERALLSQVPLLGICRGAQLINVVLGGTLFKDIRPMREHTPNKWSILPIKDVQLYRHTQLGSLLSRDVFRVNSLHNQAIDKLGAGLQLAATDKDGFTQAVELREANFVVGVQWHPEYLPYKKTQRQLMNAFANAVKHSSTRLAH